MLNRLVHVLAAIKEGMSDFGALPVTFWDAEYGDPRFFKELVAFHWSAIRFIPEELISSEMAVSAVEQEPTSLQYVPQPLRTAHLCVMALARNAACFSQVPEHVVTDQMCRDWLDGASDNPNAVLVLPVRYRTYEMHLHAVRANPWAIVHVPPDQHCDEMCSEFQAASDDPILTQFPMDHRSYALCRAAMSMRNDSLDDVPLAYRDFEMCQCAVTSVGRNIFYVPNHVVTPELWQIAVSEDHSLLAEVPERFRSQDLYRVALRSDVEALKDVPLKERTPELCRLAIQIDPKAIVHVPPGVAEECVRQALLQDGRNLRYLSEEMRSIEVCREVVLHAEKNRGAALEYVPLEHKLPEICRAAVAADGSSLQYVPPNQRDDDLCAIALADDRAIAYLPPRFMTLELAIQKVLQNGANLGRIPQHIRRQPEICNAAVMQSKIGRGAALEFVPKKQRSRAMYEAALQEDGRSLRYIPLAERKTNPDLCLLAVRQNPAAIQYVPREVLEQNADISRAVLVGFGPELLLALRYLPRVHLPHESVNYE